VWVPAHVEHKEGTYRFGTHFLVIRFGDCALQSDS
jgi:hypothetical protein